MKTIKIISKRYGIKNVLVDDGDYSWLNSFSWFLHKKPNGLFRAGKNKTVKNKFGYMSRMILNITDPNIKVDHIDKNPLNNQRKNLRICNAYQSACNISSAKNSSSKYLGVSFSKRETKRKKKDGRIVIDSSPAWRALIHKNYKKFHLGWFKKEKDAAEAYNVAAIKLHGSFASLNKI